MIYSPLFKSSFEGARDFLVPPVFRVGLLPVETKGFHRRGVLDGKENDLFFALIDMFMPGPRRNDEEIAALPVKAFAVDDRVSSSLKNMINGAAHLTVGPRVDAGSNQLNVAADGREGRPAGHGI